MCLMPATQTNPKPVFLLSSKVEHVDKPTLYLTVEPAYFNEDNDLRFYSAGLLSSASDDNALGDFRVTALHDINTTLNESFGWRVEYRDVYSAGLARVEAMAKTLRKVERGMQKLDMLLGSPETFAAYVIRVGTVLGVKQYGHEQTKEAKVMTGERFRWGDPDTLRWQINQRIADFDKQYGPVKT